MSEPIKNYAFIDSRLVDVNWPRFRVWLRANHRVKKAYIFLAYEAAKAPVYHTLKSAGYELIFKTGSITAELVLQAMMDYRLYDQAVIVTGNPDLFCLIKYLIEHEKLRHVIVPDPDGSTAWWRQPPLSPGTLSLLSDVKAALQHLPEESAVDLKLL